MKNTRHVIYCVIICLLLNARGFAQADSTVNYNDSVHGQRYCEIVLVKATLTNVTVDVYNTLGYNACPEEQWKNISTDKLKKEFSVHTVVANGPRYFLMDKIGIFNNDTATVSFDSLQMKEWIKMKLSIGAALSLKKNEAYKDRPFKFKSASIFNAGTTVFELVSPSHTYVMQSYSTELDSSLTEATLPGLEQKLKLPDGWQYKTVILDSILHLVTDDAKESYGIEDELGNRYQRVD